MTPNGDLVHSAARDIPGFGIKRNQTANPVLDGSRVLWRHEKSANGSELSDRTDL